MGYNPGTRGGPGGRDQMLAEKLRKDAQKCFFQKRIKITNVCAQIFQLCQNIGGNKFSALVVSPKAKDVKEREREKSESR